jgi:hypothetical protein
VVAGRVAFGFLVALGLGASLPAAAQWFGITDPQLFDMKSALTCIDKPETPGCKPPPAPPPSAAKPAPKPSPEVEQQQAKVSAESELKSAIVRIQENHQTEKDMQLLEDRAVAGNPAAVEVLAWTYLYGRGHPADPVKAYRIYGLAAEKGVANAVQNQMLIFKQMTGEQKQQILDEANKSLQKQR